MINHNLSIWHLIYHLSPKYFFYPKFLLISLLQFFFIKCSNNFFTIEIINNICPWNYIFNFFNYKNLFRTICYISFSKNIFVFRNSERKKVYPERKYMFKVNQENKKQCVIFMQYDNQ